MAFRFDFLNSKDNRTTHDKEREQRETKDNKPLTASDVVGIVNREMNSATAKNQLMGYFDGIAASSLRTEAMLTELRDVLDSSLDDIREAAQNGSDQEKIERIDESVRRVVELTANLEQIDESVKRVAAMTDNIQQMDMAVRRVEENTGRFDDIDRSIKNVEAATVRFDDIDRSIKRVEEATVRFDDMDRSIKNVEAATVRFDDMDRSIKRVEEATGRFDDMDRSIKRVEEATGRFDDIEQSIRRVEMATGRLEQMDASLRNVESIGGSLEHIDESTRQSLELCESLASTVHKDNLIIYRNIKNCMDAITENNQRNGKALRSGLIVSIVFNAVTVIILVAIWVMYLM